MRGEVVGRFPFDAADVGGGGDRGAVTREVAGRVGGRFVGGIGGDGVGDDVQVVEEDPEDFFRDVDDFFAPDAVRAGLVD